MGQAETKIIRIENHGMTRIGKKKMFGKKIQIIRKQRKNRSPDKSCITQIL